METSEAPVFRPFRSDATVLSESSLGALARELVKNAVSPVVFLMYLNIPTTTIIHHASRISDMGLKNADKIVLSEFTKKLLMYWKNMRATAKEKDKVQDIERALKEMGNSEMAEVIREKHQASVELTAEDFA